MWLAILAVFIVAGGVYEATVKTVAQVQPAQLAGDEAARMAQFQAAHEACDAMESMVVQSTQAMNAMDFEHALGSANEGLTHQDGCTFDTKPAFAGILLSVKAVAEHFMSRGNAQADIDAANLLLEQCQAETGPQDATNVRNCSDWLGKNRLYEQQWADGQ